MIMQLVSGTEVGTWNIEDVSPELRREFVERDVRSLNDDKDTLYERCNLLRVRVEALERDLHQEKEYTSNLVKKLNELRARVSVLGDRLDKTEERTDSMYFDTDVPAVESTKHKFDVIQGKEDNG